MAKMETNWSPVYLVYHPAITSVFIGVVYSNEFVLVLIHNSIVPRSAMEW